MTVELSVENFHQGDSTCDAVTVQFLKGLFYSYFILTFNSELTFENLDQSEGTSGAAALAASSDAAGVCVWLCGW